MILKRTNWIASLAGLIVVTSTLFAGGSSYSSSRYGLVEYRPSIRSTGMGGLIIALAPYNSINNYNPAGLIGLTNSRFEGSVFYEGNAVASRGGSAFSDLAHLNQAAFAIPFGNRLAASLYLARYSSVNYNYSRVGAFQDEIFTEKYTGEGGIRQLGFSMAWLPVPSTRVGLSLQYMSGSIGRHWVVNWASDDFDDSDDLIQENIRGLRLTGGAIHTYGVYDFGLTVALPARMERDEVLQNATGDTTSYRRVYEGLPFELGIGAVYKGFKGYRAGADLVFATWNNIEPFGQSQKHRNTVRFAIGGERLPSESVSANYFQLWSYRAGFYLQSLYASNVTGKFASEYFLTTGATIPFNKGRNQLDLAIEIGQRGSIGAFRVRDRIMRISLAVSGGERWFQNRQKRQ